MHDKKTTHFDDNNFLQDWLENRYGCGFARTVMDDLTGCEDQMFHATYETCQDLVANDNALNQQVQKAS